MHSSHAEPSSFDIPALNDIATDVVIVPDFTKPKRYVDFAMRTLLFLASWELRVGSARATWGVHVASIGEPPRAVRVLAEEVGASVQVCEPLVIGRCKFANKMRGLEIDPAARRGERVLLLDTDIFVVGDPRPVAAKVQAYAIAAALSGSRRLSEQYWTRIYKTLSLPEPAERVPLLPVHLGLWEGEVVEKRGKHVTDLRAMWPYFNGGVVLCPWAAPLRETWAQHMVAIFEEFAPGRNVWEKLTLRLSDPDRVNPPDTLTASDQASLATAIQALGAQGWSFSPLPDALNTRRAHFASGTIKWSEAAIWHALMLGRGVSTWADVEPHLQAFGAQADGFMDQGAKRRAEDTPPSTAVREFLNELLQTRLVPLVAAHPVVGAN